MSPTKFPEFLIRISFFRKNPKSSWRKLLAPDAEFAQTREQNRNAFIGGHARRISADIFISRPATPLDLLLRYNMIT
jgi:hypothetical protein